MKAGCTISFTIVLIYYTVCSEARRRQGYMPFGSYRPGGSLLNNLFSNSCPNCGPCGTLSKPNARCDDANLPVPGGLGLVYRNSGPDILPVSDGGKHNYYVGDDGVISAIDPAEPVDKTLIATHVKDPTNNYFFLFTRRNPYSPQRLIYGEVQTLASSYYVPMKNTIFIAHGWRGHAKNNMNRVLTRAFLNNSDVNVIVFDWSKIANPATYNTARAATAPVGHRLGTFISWMVYTGYLMYYKTHMVGYGLGAHLVGNAGRINKGSVSRISALDPAGLFWYEDTDRLAPTDAQYVEVIHTNAKLNGGDVNTTYGYVHPCGDADFYPNGGTLMEGCGSSNVCSHSRSYEYMAASLTYDRFKGKQCSNYNEMSDNKCEGPISFMGNAALYKTERGIYRLNTKAHYPYV